MMRLSSTAFADGGRIPAEFAFCAIDPAAHVKLSENLNPDLRWSDLPRGHEVAGTDLPRPRCALARGRRQPGRPHGTGVAASRRFLSLGAGRPAAGYRADLPRRVLARRYARAASPARERRVERSTASTITPAGSPATRIWRATTSATTGRVRRGTTSACTTTCSRSTRSTCRNCRWALAFSGADARGAMRGHILAQAALTGVYSLNPSLRG